MRKGSPSPGYADGRAVRSTPGPEEMVQCINGLPPMREDWSLDPQIPCTSQAREVAASNSSTLAIDKGYTGKLAS